MEVSMDKGTTAGEVYETLLRRYPLLRKHRLHLSLNQKFAKGDEVLKHRDELAIFTAVSGG